MFTPQTTTTERPQNEMIYKKNVKKWKGLSSKMYFQISFKCFYWRFFLNSRWKFGRMFICTPLRLSIELRFRYLLFRGFCGATIPHSSKYIMQENTRYTVFRTLIYLTQNFKRCFKLLDFSFDPFRTFSTKQICFLSLS